MDNSVTAPCEACGGLLPLIPIQKRRRGKQRQSRSLQPNHEEPRQPKDVSRSKDSHCLQTEFGSPSYSENSADLENSIPSSTNSDGETKGSSGKRRSYDSVLEDIQAIFAGQKVKKVTISAYMHRYRRQLQRKQHERIQDHERAINQHAFVSKSRSRGSSGSPAETRSPSDVNLSWRPHPHRRRRTIEPTCTRVVGQLPPDDIASNWSFDPLRISPAPRVYEERPPHLLPEFGPTQSCTHQLGEHCERGKIVRDAVTWSSPPCSASTKQKNHRSRHGALADHQEACRPPVISWAERDRQPRVDNDCYHDVIRLYEECLVHQIDEHITATLITSPRGSRKSQLHSYEESGFQTQPQPQPQEIVYSCHQHVCQQTVVLHREGCELHRRDDLESPRALSPTPRDSSKCPRCGCIQQDYPTTQEGSFQGPADCKSTCHQMSESYVKTVRGCEQEVTACAQRLSSCHMHGDCSQQKIDVCGVRRQKDLQKKFCEDRNCPICKHPCKDHIDTSPQKETILRCHLHADSPPPAPKPTCAQAPKDPLVWTPRRVWKPKPSAVHWLDRITVSQKIPSHIVRQYLQGKRRCPPRWKKQKCSACVGKSRDGNVSSRPDPCRRVVPEPWNSGSDIAAASTVECKEWKERRGKLSRLALSRTLIVKPVPKVSTSQRLWTRKEFEVCSECRDLKLFRSIGIKSGRWSSILETMSSTTVCEGAEMSSNCSTKFSCHTMHGLSIPGSTRAMDLRGPELNSAFRLRTKLQKLQNETFDRRAAVQASRDLPYG